MAHSECRSELLRGPLYYVLVLMAATVVYWRDSPVGVVAMSLMCGGDGLADVVGRRLGQGNPLPWNPAKSWAGSAAMLLGEALPLLWSCMASTHHMGSTHGIHPHLSRQRRPGGASLSAFSHVLHARPCCSIHMISRLNQGSDACVHPS